VKNAEKESEKKFNRDDATIDLIWKRYEDAAKNVRSGVAITVNGATVLGTLAETSTYYAGSMISTYTWSDGQRKAIMPFAIAMVWMRIGNQVIRLSAVYPFSGKASILAANDTLLNWLKSVTASN
jgi:hypothetical protein